MAELNTIITLRQGTTAEWNSSTIVLKIGEMGLEYLADGTVKISGYSATTFTQGTVYDLHIQYFVD